MARQRACAFRMFFRAALRCRREAMMVLQNKIAKFFDKNIRIGRQNFEMDQRLPAVLTQIIDIERPQWSIGTDDEKAEDQSRRLDRRL